MQAPVGFISVSSPESGIYEKIRKDWFPGLFLYVSADYSVVFGDVILYIYNEAKKFSISWVV
jgi:hypothetical protein